MSNIGKIEPAPIVEEMKRSYLDYAMSVIVARALPDVRDGLKPVHRRIIYAMHQQGLHHTARYQKSAAVVGEVLKNYHPHGDIPVYDAMVRMAQDFSMRYMLVDGQGNFGCFTKDTRVKLTDGRDLSFENLIDEYQKGKINYTYTVNSLGLISISEIKNPRLTIQDAVLVKVTLDNGEKIRCTPNHRFLLKDGSYKEAQFLTPDDSLMPLYHKISQKTDRINREGYLLVHQVKTDTWVPAHHLADNYNLTQGKYDKSAGRVRHHINFDKNNNNPDNITRLNWEQHWQVHYQYAASLHQNSEYRKKIADGRNSFWANQSNRDKQALRMSLRNSQNWQDQQYREKMSHLLSEVNITYIQKHPEKRQEFSQRIHNTLIKLWKNPEYRAQMHKKIILGNKNHTTNTTGKTKFVNICKVTIKQFSVLDEEKYSQIRKQIYPYGAAPKWQTGVNKYFENNPDLIRLAINGNHRVVKVEKLIEREDVYDLTIEKSHNFALASGVFVHNSVDGDSAAAMRYTEARLSAIADELLRDIHKDTVDFIDNYSGTTQEPTVLPSVIPNLLLNGASGIAVGMATQIPPHNLGELIDALAYMIDHPSKKDGKQNVIPAEVLRSRGTQDRRAGIQNDNDEAGSLVKPGMTTSGGKFESETTVEELIQFVKGPDFPTGGSIYDQSEIMNAYATGKGRIVMRAKAEIEEAKNGRFDIIITELPYQVNKAALVTKIAELHKDKKVEGIADLRDESDRRGMRVVIELKKDARPKSTLNNLFKHTAMQSVFNVNTVALVDGVPRLLPLKHILEEFVTHRQIVIRRRSEFELREAKAREHILEGLMIAVSNIDAVIETIKKSKDSEEAKTNLMTKFKLSELQAVAILDLQLRRLAALERQKIEDELKMVKETIDYLEDLLAHPEKMLKVIKEELLKVKEKYGDDRKTRVYKQKVGEFSEEDLIADEQTIVTITDGGYIKRQAPSTFRVQNRGGKGVSSMTTKEADAVSHIFYTKTLDNILFFTDKGRAFQLKVWEIPEASRIAKGQAIVNLINTDPGEKITAILTLRQKDDSKFLFMCTKKGNVKKTPIEEYASIRRNGLISIKLETGDTLSWVTPTNGSDELIVISGGGQSIRFHEKDTRPTHRDTSGVRGIKLSKDDSVVSMNKLIDAKTDQLLVIMANGLGKKTMISSWTNQIRGGMGVKAAQVTPKTGPIVTAEIVKPDCDTLVLTSNKGQLIKIDIKDVPTLQRQTQGVILMRMREGEKVAAATVVSKEKESA